MSFKAIIEADIKLFNQNIDKARAEMDKLEKSTTRSLSKIGDSFISIGKRASILSAGLVAIGTKSFLMAADFEDALGATDQVFEGMSETVKAWANQLDSAYGIAKKDALEYSNVMGTMLINIGNLSRKEAQKTSASLVELAGDLTAMFGGTTENAVNALTASLRGNNIMLNKYGIAINDVMVKQKALEMGLMASTSEMTLQARQAATLALIMEQSASAQGQAAREADSASGSMRALRTEIANLSTEIGEVLLPIITPMVAKLRDITAGFREMSPEMQKTVVTVGAVTAAIGPLLVVTGKILKTLPLIKAALVALTGPIGIVVGAIVAGTTLIIANWDKLKNASRNVVKYIKDDWNTLKNGFDEDTNWFSYRWNQIKNLFKDQRNPNQAGLEAALAANEMTGSMGAVKKSVEETIQPTVDLAKANDDLAKSQERVVDNLKAMQLVIPKKEVYSLFDTLFTQSGNELILNPTVEPNIDSATLKSKMYEAVKSAMGDLSEGIKVISIDLTEMLTSTLENVFGAVSTAIMEGDNVMEALGASLLGTLGGIMVDLGKMAIGIGVGLEAIKKAFQSLNPALAIGGGAALIALGSLFSAGARKLGNSMGGGGYSAAPSMANSSPSYGHSEYRGAYQDDFTVTFVQKGSDLVGVLDTAEQRRRRT